MSPEKALYLVAPPPPSHTAEWQVMCIFKALHQSGPRTSHSDDDDDEGVKDLTLEQFYGFYEVFNLKWKRVCVVVVVVVVVGMVTELHGDRYRQKGRS